QAAAAQPGGAHPVGHRSGADRQLNRKICIDGRAKCAIADRLAAELPNPAERQTGLPSSSDLANPDDPEQPATDVQRVVLVVLGSGKKGEDVDVGVVGGFLAVAGERRPGAGPQAAKDDLRECPLLPCLEVCSCLNL